MAFKTAVGCKSCGKSIPQDSEICPYCNKRQSEPNVLTAATSSTPLALDQRRLVLQQSVAHYSAHGYRVVSQTDTTAQMMRPKRFSFVAAVLWFFLFGIGLLVYIFYYLAKRDSLLFVQVDEFGKVTAT